VPSSRLVVDRGRQDVLFVQGPAHGRTDILEVAQAFLNAVQETVLPLL
jgi:hypothetical protein